ncbi:MAG: hypothetical protein WAS51_14430 [Ilumatobacteraceae bacterium]
MGILYDTDRLDNATRWRLFNVTATAPQLLTAAGLGTAECVQIYRRVKDVAPGTACETWAWTPLIQCGVPVELCGSNTQLVVTLPGTYAVGDPTSVPVFAGPVVIDAQSLAGMPAELLAQASECPDVCVPDSIIGVQSDWAVMRS